MIRQDNDLQLVQRIAAGNEAALEALYAAYGQRMAAFALRMTGDPALADEIVQESLIGIWQSARSYRGEGRLITWLLGIVHHKALQQLRRRALPSLDEDGQDEPPSGDPLPGDLAEQAERQRLLRAGLRQLTPEHRAVLELVFYQGLSLNEVAEVCACPAGTVKSRLSYAKNALRGLMNREGWSAEDVK
jgi:RNA polymerase sigma-70 factor, ECF subfamily